MENKEFDKFIASSIERIETPYDTGAWEKMEASLDLDEGFAVHDPIDDLARKSIRNADTTYRPEYWDQMSQRIDEEYSLLRKVYRYKVLETALAILIIFTLINFLPSYQGLFHLQLRPATPAARPEMPEAVKSDNREHAAVNPVTSPISKSSIATGAVQRERTGNILKSKSPGQIITANAINSGVTPPHSAVPHAGQDILSEHSTTSLISMAIASPLEPTPIPETEANITSRVVATTNPIPVPMPEIGFNIAAATTPVTQIHTSTAARKSFRVGILTALDLDHVKIPYSYPFENEAPYEQWSSGYSSGISMGLAIKSWEIEAAALYSSKRYSSNKVIQGGDFYTGYFRDSLRNVELNLVKIPVSVHYDIANKGRMRVYAAVGAALNIALTGNYDRDITPWGTIAPGGSTALRSSVDRDGVLEGGKFDENFYASVDAGIGFEYALTPGLSVYAQGNYQHHLGTLGPNRDKINTGSIVIGARHNL